MDDEIIIKDESDFELCSDDDIQDVLPDQQKTMKVILKGMGQSILSSSVISSQQPSLIAQNPSVISQSSQVAASNPVVPPPAVAYQLAADKPFLVDAFVKPGRLVKPYEIVPCDEKKIQIKFICPQLENPEVLYGIVVPRELSYWNLSQ